jgi:prepilin-type N-terminal cleavage/methylation domain-containing protein
MLKVLRRKKGMTIIEVIVSLTLLAVLSVPISMLFLNSMKTVTLANEQIELNAVTRVIKEDVTNSVKNGVELPTIAAGSVILKTDINGTDITVIDNKNIINNRYKFNAVRTKDFSSNADYGKTCEYTVTIFKISGNKKVREFKLSINSLDDQSLN